MRQASGISERGPSRPEAWITTGKTGLCVECDQRVEPWHEVLLGDEDDPLQHVECAEGDDDEGGRRGEAVIKRVETLTYASDDGAEYEHDGLHPDLDGHPECPACWAEDIRRALGWQEATP